MSLRFGNESLVSRIRNVGIVCFFCNTAEELFTGFLFHWQALDIDSRERQAPFAFAVLVR